jgi:hypothetical protein
MDNIIGRAAAAVPRAGMSSTLPIQNFNLKNMIPKDAFFSYSVPSVKYDVIVFGITSSIPVMSQTIDKLSKIIKPPSPFLYILAGANNKLFYNKKGPALSKATSGNDIYIDCQPTNQSEEEIVLSKTTDAAGNPINVPSAQTHYDLGTATGFTTFLQIFLVSILIFAILFGCYYAISKINTKYEGATMGKVNIEKKTFKFTNADGLNTAIYLIAYIMWAALLAVLYFAFQKK